MKFARYKTEQGQWGWVRIDDYNPEIHGTKLLCDDPDVLPGAPGCPVEVEPRLQEGRVQGDSWYRGSCFAARSGSEHSPDCSTPKSINYAHKSSVTFPAACEEMLPVLFNFNGAVGSTRKLPSVHEMDGAELNTPYNRFRRRRHTSVAVKTLPDFFWEVAHKVNRHPSGLDAFFFGHRQNVRPLSEVWCRDGLRHFRALYHSFTAAASKTRKDVMTGFPRIFQFEASHKKENKYAVPYAANEVGENVRQYYKVASGPFSFNGNGESPGGIFLENVLSLNGEENVSLKEKILEAGSVWVIAEPSVHRAEIMPENVQEWLMCGGNVYLRVRWNIVSAAQLMPIAASASIDLAA